MPIKGQVGRPGIGAATSAILLGTGDTTTPYADNNVSKNFLGFWVKSTAATGTTRGNYTRLYLSSGAGGEAARIFTTVENNAPVDTVNGAHTSLSFGSSAGNVTGEGQASRNTLHIPNRALNGTVAAIKAELWADGASSDIGQTCAFIRCTAGGTQGGIDKVDDKGVLLYIDGLTAGAAHLFATGLTAATVNAATTCSLKIKVGGTTYYIPVATAIA
jgi:hypothetical protein